SSHFPTVDPCFSLRARNPSIQSVENKTTRIMSALPQSSLNMSQTNTGTNKNLINVTSFGIVSQSLPTVIPASSFGSGFSGRFMSPSLWGLHIYQQKPTGVAADAKALQR